MESSYPVQFDIDYPDRPLNRLTTAFRIFVAIPILIVIGALSGGSYRSGNQGATYVMAGGLCLCARDRSISTVQAQLNRSHYWTVVSS
jgi:hypothetical protein